MARMIGPVRILSKAAARLYTSGLVHRTIGRELLGYLESLQALQAPQMLQPFGVFEAFEIFGGLVKFGAFGVFRTDKGSREEG